MAVGMRGRVAKFLEEKTGESSEFFNMQVGNSHFIC